LHCAVHANANLPTAVASAENTGGHSGETNTSSFRYLGRTKGLEPSRKTAHPKIVVSPHKSF
jgi:hypothetical protein